MCGGEEPRRTIEQSGGRQIGDTVGDVIGEYRRPCRGVQPDDRMGSVGQLGLALAERDDAATVTLRIADDFGQCLCSAGELRVKKDEQQTRRIL